MVSDFAIEQIEDLQEAGYTLSLRQIIEINTLGCAVQFAAPEVLSAPRMAKIGDIWLQELSIQAEFWFRDFAGKWWSGQSLVWALGWANFHSRDLGFFDDFTHERRTRIRIEAWYRGLNCTELEFNAAFNYVNRTERFRGPADAPDAAEADGLDWQPDTPDALSDIVAECLSIGLHDEQIYTRTRRELTDILERNARRLIQQGATPESVRKILKDAAETRFLKYVDRLKAQQNSWRRSAQIYG